MKKQSPIRQSADSQRTDTRQFYLIADNIRSLENIGSFFRTADALGIEKIFLCGISGTPPRQKISKTALGAESWTPWEYRKYAWRLVEELQEQSMCVVCLEQARGSIDIARFRPKFPLALVVGNEVNGVSRAVLQRANTIVHIPMHGQKESLNVAVALGVALYEISRKFRRARL